jgi:hypothetical protein
MPMVGHVLFSVGRHFAIVRRSLSIFDGAG